MSMGYLEAGENKVRVHVVQAAHILKELMTLIIGDRRYQTKQAVPKNPRDH